MKGILSPIQKFRVLPAIAVLASFFLVAGQVFNCCRFNETVAADLTGFLKSWGIIGSHTEANAEAGSHPGCHGHGKEKASETPSVVLTSDAENLLTEETNCISEFAFTAKAQLPGSFFVLDFSGKFPAFRAIDFSDVQAMVERPRPQNKSSPPVYLLTRRLLV